MPESMSYARGHGYSEQDEQDHTGEAGLPEMRPTVSKTTLRALPKLPNEPLHFDTVLPID